MLSRPASVALAATDFATAALIGCGVFVALPIRWFPVDVVAVLLAALELLSGVALIGRLRWSLRFSAFVAATALGIGLVLVTTLAVTASWLSGVYGPVGRGGALILVLVAALTLPYLVAIPAAKLLWVWRLRSKPESSR
ncbi:MAG: hypothetical protein ABSC94_12130 [Polyangiaceae bacterium]|jgi:hypothetical protein